MRFRNRISLFIIVLIAGVQGIAIAVSYSYARHAMIDQGKRDLAIANQTFMRHLDILADRVATGVNVLALDFGLRQAIAENDHATALSALRNHGRRINARRMMYVDVDGVVRADTAAPDSGARPFPFEDLIDKTYVEGVSTGLVTLGGETYWTVVAPVTAPTLIGFVGAFVPVDGALLDELRNLAPTPLSIALATADPHGELTLLTASADRQRNMPLPAAFNPLEDIASIVRRPEGDFLYSVARLPTAQNSSPVYVIHEHRLEDVFASNWALFGPLLFVMIGGVGLAAAGAFVIAHGVSAPLETLAAAARRISKGDYEFDASVGSASSEVGQLSGALTDMAGAVRDREDALKETARSLEIARDEARDADRVKSQFIANMSHELRTPLNAIIGFADVIRQQQLGPIPEDEYLKYADFIANGGRGLLDLHNSILDIARIEAGKFDLRPDLYDLREVMDDAIDFVSAAAVSKNISINKRAGDAHVNIDGDFAALSKALRNILHNAVKFSPADGVVDIYLEARDGEADIVVRDSGVGMAQEEVARLIKPFQRSHGEYDAAFPGAGLGLSIADAIVRLHGGKLSIVSAPMAGTTVTIRLPLKASSSALREVA